MASAPLNWLLKIGGDALNTTAQTLSGAVNELKQSIASVAARFSTINNVEDVNITSPSDGQLLGYDGTNEEWKNINGNFMNTDGSNAADNVTFPKNLSAGSTINVGSNAVASSIYANAFGTYVTASGTASHAEGRGYNATYHNAASGSGSHAEGYSSGSDTTGMSREKSVSASGMGAHAEGCNTSAIGNYSHAEGHASKTYAQCDASHAEGFATDASNVYCHAEGAATRATGQASHSEGFSIYGDETKRIKATGTGSHAEGCVPAGNGSIVASGDGAHAEGCSNDNLATEASGLGSHAEGGSTTASGNYSHAEGKNTTASGIYSHAEGQGTTASGSWSHAGGRDVSANRNYSFVHGNYDDSSKKFRSTTMDGYGQAFGFAMSGDEVKTDTAITTSKNGCQGCIEDTATVTLSIEPQGMYLLIVDAFTISTGALYGATVNLITGHGLNTGTPTNTVIKATSNAPATITTAANNKITIKNGAAARATQFTLIRVA